MLIALNLTNIAHVLTLILIKERSRSRPILGGATGYSGRLCAIAHSEQGTIGSVVSAHPNTPSEVSGHFRAMNQAWTTKAFLGTLTV